MDEKEFKKIIAKYRKGTTDKSDRDHLQNFERYFEDKNGSAVFKSEQHKKQIQKSIFSGVKQKMEPSYSNWYWMVAAVSVLFTAGLFYFLSSSTTTAPLMVNIGTGENQIKTIVLQDSSQITLNENSVLEFPEEFSDTLRYVKLQGEAFFDISHNSDKPFRVITDSVITEVLGTEFNIQTQKNSVSVALISGSVHVQGLGVEQLLRPSEKLNLDIGSREAELKKFNSDMELFWMHQKLVFDNVSLTEIIKTLQQHFDVSFSIQDPSLADLAITGTFKGKGLSAILLAMSKAGNFNFKNTGENHISLYKAE